MTRVHSVLALGVPLLAASAGCAAPQSGDAVVEVQGKVVYGTDDRTGSIRVRRPGLGRARAGVHGRAGSHVADRRDRSQQHPHRQSDAEPSD